MSSLSIRERQPNELIVDNFFCGEQPIQTIVADIIRQGTNSVPDGSWRERHVELQRHTISQVAKRIVEIVKYSEHWPYFLQKAYPYSNGDLYIGEKRNDLENGYGVMLYANEAVYRGGWLNGRWSGEGTMTFQDGGFISGNFVDGSLEGEGSMRSPHAFWKGMWHEGRLHGLGKGSISDGKYVYCGEWKEGEPDGWGIAQNSSYIHIGEWENGMPNGWGRGIYKDGKVLEGTWVNGELQSSGRRTFSWFESGWESLIIDRNQALSRAP